MNGDAMDFAATRKVACYAQKTKSWDLVFEIETDRNDLNQDIVAVHAEHETCAPARADELMRQYPHLERLQLFSEKR